jgi:hypothetical protein
MDDGERKIFVQFDDPMPGQRVNALEALREHMLKKTPPRTFRDIAQEDETAAATIAGLQSQVTQEQQLNAQNQQMFNQAIAQRDATIRQLQQRLSAVAWVKAHWQQLAAATAVPVIGLAAWCFWPDETRMHREAVDNGFTRLAASTPWQASGQYSTPVVRPADGQSYWVTAKFDANTTHFDANGRPVLVQCVHLYAAPAVADAGAYFKPSPFALFGWGWLTWPERGMSCRPVKNDTAAQLSALPRADKPSAQLVTSAEAAPAGAAVAGDEPPCKMKEGEPELDFNSRNCWAVMHKAASFQEIPRKKGGGSVYDPMPAQLVEVLGGFAWMPNGRPSGDMIVRLADGRIGVTFTVDLSPAAKSAPRPRAAGNCDALGEASKNCLAMVETNVWRTIPISQGQAVETFSGAVEILSELDAGNPDMLVRMKFSGETGLVPLSGLKPGAGTVRLTRGDDERG